MSFINFPAELPEITKAVSMLLSEALGPPPDMRSLGQRAYESLLECINDLSQVKKRDWRHLPYAIWLDKNNGIYEHKILLDHFFNVELPLVLESGRRPIKWSKPLLFTYVEKFNPLDSIFIKLSKESKIFFDSPKLTNKSSVVKLVRDLDLFNISAGPKKTAKSIVDSRRNINEWIAIHDLWNGFINSPFAEAAYNEFLNSEIQFRRSLEFIEIIMDWSISSPRNLRYENLRSNLADSLLLPWRDVKPADNIKNKITSFLLLHFDDPRLRNNRWHQVSPEAIKIFYSWINEQTLELFFNILRATADDIWEYRQKFWNAYLKKNYIEEAWVVLGPEAISYISRVSNVKNIKYAELSGGIDNQSVLLLKIGDYLFCEWSHSGRLRSQVYGAPKTPALYKNYYSANDLRFESLDFNNKQNENPGLVHFSSDNGGWQERARNFIRKETGINLPLSEVMK